MNGSGGGPLAAAFGQRDGWMANAACRGMGPSLFFPEHGVRGIAAIKVCQRCPVLAECRQFSNEYPERYGASQYGVWAGVHYGRTNKRSAVTTLHPNPTPVELRPRKENGMKPETLSASAAKTYEECSARYKAEYIDRARMPSGDAASLGTVCHEALDGWVRDGHYLVGHAPQHAKTVIQAIYDEAYWRHFSTEKFYAEGLKMVHDWLARQDWEGREVVSVEEKKSFDVPTSAGPLRLNYIMDRFDKIIRSDDLLEVEVIDYKSYRAPMPADELKRTVQARIYALAAQIEFPDAQRVRVVFDLLRHDPIGLVFTRDENKRTWAYLKALAERILADDGTTETLNDGCRYCVRKGDCDALAKHAAANGPLAITDITMAAAKLHDVERAIKALQAHEVELQKVVLAHLEHEKLLGEVLGDIEVEVSVSGRRNIDPQMARGVLGDTLMAEYGSLRMSDVDELLKGSTLTADQKKGLRRLIGKTYGAPKVKTSRVAVA